MANKYKAWQGSVVEHSMVWENHRGAEWQKVESDSLGKKYAVLASKAQTPEEYESYRAEMSDNMGNYNKLTQAKRKAQADHYGEMMDIEYAQSRSPMEVLAKTNKAFTHFKW